MDMFSEPFAFRFGKKDEKKSTSLGYLTTLAVIGVSVAYLVYLILAYINNSFAPTVIQEQQSVSSVTQDLEYSPIMFKFNVPPQITAEIQQRYFRYYAQLATGNTDGKNISIVSCKDVPENSNYSQYYCLDPSKMGTLSIDSDGNYNQIYIRVWQCALPPETNECERPEDILPIMRNRMFSIEVLIAYYEFNSETEEPELRYKKRNIPGDDSIVAWQIVELKQTTLKIDKGFFLEDWRTYEFISDYSQDLIPLQQDFMQRKYGLKAPVFMQFEIRMELSNILITVQYIKLSTLLAMFSAIFGVLIHIGIIGKLASKSVIYKEMLDNYIKEFYREAAFQIARKQDMKEKQQKFDEKHVMSQQEISKIKNKMLRDNLLQANGEFSSILTYLKSMRSSNQKNSSNKVSTETYIMDDFDQDQLYEMANKKLPDLMNAKLLYNEIYSLKTAVQLLMKPDQYAMMVNIGRRLVKNELISHLDEVTDRFTCLNVNSHPSKIQAKLNHLEQMNLIDDNPEVREKLCQRFLIEKYQTNAQVSEVDQRILGSVLTHLREQVSERLESPIIQSLNESLQEHGINQVK